MWMLLFYNVFQFTIPPFVYSSCMCCSPIKTFFIIPSTGITSFWCFSTCLTLLTTCLSFHNWLYNRLVSWWYTNNNYNKRFHHHGKKNSHITWYRNGIQQITYLKIQNIYSELLLLRTPLHIYEVLCVFIKYIF